MVRIYLSSPITKDPDYRSTFAKLAKEWRAAGWQVFSAAEMNDMLGDDRGREDAMRVDIPILLTCDSILMANGWESSRCCRCEWAIAEACGITIHYEGGQVPNARWAPEMSSQCPPNDAREWHSSDQSSI